MANNKKLSTGIEGLDAMFYGGIHLEYKDDDNKGLLMLARGEHGVNKIHLAMQICEGMYSKSIGADQQKYQPLFCEEELKRMAKFGRCAANSERNQLRNTLWEEKSCEQYWSSLTDLYRDEASLKQFTDTLIEYLFVVLREKTNVSWEEFTESAFKNNGITIIKKIRETGLKAIKETAKIQKDFYIKKRKEENDSNKIEKEIKKWESVYNKCDDCNDNIQYLDRVIIRNAEKKSTNHLLSVQDITSNTDILCDVLCPQASKPKILYVSLNKDSELLKCLYYDFYIKRLIQIVRQSDEYTAERERKEPNGVSVVKYLREMLWYEDDTEQSDIRKRLLERYGFRAIPVRNKQYDDKMEENLFNDIKTGFIYYNVRTHGLHVRHQKGARDKGNLLLCKRDVPEHSSLKIVGKEDLGKGNLKTDGVTIFMKMMEELEKEEYDEVEYIMIDGLSRLSKEELAQCPLNALSDKLRKRSKRAAIITADEKLAPTDISVDIVIDMAIKQRENTDQQYNALKISKCLYQKNAYGWHNYKMRTAGIEVIPSLHLQLKTRFLMDDAVSDANLPIDKFPYPYWLNERHSVCIDAKVNEVYETGYRTECEDPQNYVNPNNDLGFGDLIFLGHELNLDTLGDTYVRIKKSAPSGRKNEELSDLIIRKTLKELVIGESHHVLFVSLNQNRTDFYLDHIKKLRDVCNEKLSNIHFFGFEPGYIHTDEFIWTIDCQVKSLARLNHNVTEDSNHFEKIHLAIGDFRYLDYMYPCLKKESLLMPAISRYTKKHHMTNFVYCSEPEYVNLELRKGEVDIYQQLFALSDEVY